jgi:quercetin dioxygenase-like cupin family protein
MAEENRTSSIREPKPNTNGGTRPADLREPDPPATDRAERRYYHPLQKDYTTFLKTSEETGGEHSLIEVEVAPGGGNTPHYHKTYAEHFEVLEGVLEVTVGGETRALHPGEKAVAPKNTLHNFRNPTSEPATFLVELRPGSAGFEKALKAGYGLAADGLTRADGTPKNLYYLAVLLDWSDIRLPGIFTVSEPLFRFLTKRARRKGVDRELEARYYR